MSDTKDESQRVARRALLLGMGGLGAAFWLGCGEGTTASSSSGGSSGGGSSGVSGGSSGTSSVDPSGFATGDGSFLTGKDYGDPFVSEGGGCTAFVGATEGPCHSNTYHRVDLTEGLVGLPTRIELRVVDAACNPIAGAIVEIWYAAPSGAYSQAAQAADDEAEYSGSLRDLNAGFCTGNNAEALASGWLRAYQVSDAAGRVHFDGIFPGWYSGRTPHIHFTVAIEGRKVLTSQVVFDEALTTQIYTGHGAYKSRGDKDTTNQNDNVVGRGGLTAAMALMEHAQQEDGALLVWKSITVG